MADLFDPLTVDPANVIQGEVVKRGELQEILQASGPASVLTELENNFLNTSDNQEESPHDLNDCDCGNCFQCAVQELQDSDYTPSGLTDQEIDDLDDWELVDLLLELEAEDG